MNTLFYGDNLSVLREHIRDESVDLIYLDPPFNSNATYNVLFRAPAGQQSEAQLEAFDDTWHWGDSAEQAFADVIRSRHTNAATMLKAMRSALGENDMMAYLAMMAARLIELHRALKPTGSLYLHCDPTASHYLKILLDSLFGADLFRNEIVWKRTTSHGDAKRRFGDTSDRLLFYGKSSDILFNKVMVSHNNQYVSDKYRYLSEDGRRYRLDNLRSPQPRPNLTYDYKGHMPHPNGWAVSRERMEQLDSAGLLEFPKKEGGRIQFRRFLKDDGMPISTLWDDIPPINSQAQERLGYPTQKPLALLERIIAASSNPGDVVLDPFCGCGTAVHAAQKLGRAWIGIDITHLSISLIERRLKDAFAGIAFDVQGTPKDLDGARDLAARSKDQFQWWAVSLVDAVPQGGVKKKGMDRGIDGIRWVTAGPKPGDVEKVIVSVKGGENVTSAMVRDLKGTMEREGAIGGLFVSLVEPTREMKREAAAAGIFSVGFGDHPKLQICTIQELLAGIKPNLPPIGRNEGFRRAPRETGPKPKQSDLGL